MLCRPGYFGCDNVCQPLSKICDGRQDCYDGTDEKTCDKSSRRIYQVTLIGVDERTVNETSFTITWWIPVPANTTFEFLPSISTIEVNKWKNHTTWLTTPYHQFSNLKPFTNYNVTVYVRVKDNPNDIFIPYLYNNITTSEGIPTEPLNVTVAQVNGSRIRVSWSPPENVYGILTSYSVNFRKESIHIEPSTSGKVKPQETSTILQGNFEGNVTYLFWVKAKNSKHESPASKMLRLTFDSVNLDNLQGVRVEKQTIEYVTLVWDPVPKAEGYIIQPVLPQFYPRIDPQKTNGTTITIHNLVPGTQYIFKVSAYKNDYHGRTTNIPVDRSNYGSPLPTIPIAGNFMNDNGSITLRWIAPKTSNYNSLTYGVYYGVSLDDLFNCKLFFCLKIIKLWSNIKYNTLF